MPSVDPVRGLGLLSREEVLGGLPARRASALLFAIESRTALRMVRTRQAVRRLATEHSAEQQERAFLDALAHGREWPVRPKIQDLERHALDWAPLVPAEPSVRAAITALLRTKYVFRRQDVPRLCDVLGLDSAAVAQAFERQQHRPVQAVYAAQIGWRERRRWTQAHAAQRLESLPPFWTAFALTLTEIVGAAILALPTAVAGDGPLAGIGLLLILGAINTLTIVALSEAFVRNGNVRFGHVYFGRLVADYLGVRGSPGLTRVLLGMISALLVADCIGALLAFCIGVSTTLAAVSGISPSIWAVLLLAVVLYFVRRQTLGLTIASAMLVGAINMGLLVLLMWLALPYVSLVNVLSPAVTPISGAVVGVIFAAYFGHFSTGTCARLVLDRDPSGRSLILGNLAAMSVAIVLNGAWVVVVSGTLAPSALLGESGTPITLLADRVGPVVNAIGVAYVILSMGLGSIHAAQALTYQVRDWLPSQQSMRRAALLGPGVVVAVFGLGEWLRAAHVSFAESLGVLGALACSVFGGMLPALLLIASRRKGEYVPGLVLRLVGHPVVMLAIYCLFAASFFVHGLVIWTDPPRRLAALLLGSALLALTAAAIARGALSSRLVVELRLEDETAAPVVSAIDCGISVPLRVRFERQVLVDVPTPHARELKLWIHRLTASGDSVPLAARVEIDGCDVLEVNGSALVPISRVPLRLGFSV